MEAWRKRVVAEASTWIGTPYHHMGRKKSIGVDCGMLIAEVYCRAGLAPRIEFGDYAPEWHFHREDEKYLEWVEKFMAPTHVAQPGDLAVFQVARCYAHGAIVSDWPMIIHASKGDAQVSLADALAGDLSRRKFKLYTWPTKKQP